MAKKIHCKHGLERKQEIEARRLRQKLENNDYQVLREYHMLWLEWARNPKKSFKEYLKEKDNVHYSAYMRACMSIGEKEIYYKIATHMTSLE